MGLIELSDVSQDGVKAKDFLFYGPFIFIKGSLVSCSHLICLPFAVSFFVCPTFSSLSFSSVMVGMVKRQWQDVHAWVRACVHAHVCCNDSDRSGASRVSLRVCPKQVSEMCGVLGFFLILFSSSNTRVPNTPPTWLNVKLSVWFTLQVSSCVCVQVGECLLLWYLRRMV